MNGKKFLVVQLGRIGDLVLLTPVLKALRDGGSGNSVHVLAGTHNCILMRDYPYLDGLHVYTKRVSGTIDLIRKLRQERFDVWIDPKGHFSRESHFFARWGRARVKVGFNRKGKGLFDIPIVPDCEQETTHAIDRNRNILRLIGISCEMHRPVLFIDEKSREAFQRYRAEHGIGEYACINLSAGSSDRLWPPEQWIEFMRRAGGDGLSLLLIAGPRDHGKASEISAVLPNCFFYPTPTILDVFPAVRCARLVVSPDTAVVHIAGAFDTPLLGLYPNDNLNYYKFKPLSSLHQVVMNPLPGGRVCDISVDALLVGYTALLSMLEGRSPD